MVLGFYEGIRFDVFSLFISNVGSSSVFALGVKREELSRRALSKGYKLEYKTHRALLFQIIENSQDRRNGSSRVNSQEAEAIADWIIGNFEFFRAIYNPGADAVKDKSLFAVVTPFAAQAREVRKTLRMKSEEIAGKVTVGTAHTLQGAERQVVLFSPVYGDNSDKASFVDGTLELMNVAVSRAKDLFIVFGGQRRWEDTGPVFGLVRQRATIGPHWFGYGGSQGLAFEAPASFVDERTPQPTPHAPAPMPVQQELRGPSSQNPLQLFSGQRSLTRQGQNQSWLTGISRVI